MEPYLITFRILHILSAIAWAGSAFLFTFFVEPTVNALGEEGGKFMGYMSRERKINVVIPIISAVTVISGGFLYWHTSNGFDLDWVTSDVGIGFTIGAVAAIIAFVLGIVLIGPNVGRMEAIGAEIAASGGPPTQEQMAGMAKVQRTLTLVGRIDIAFIGIAALAMSTARYLNF